MTSRACASANMHMLELHCCGHLILEVTFKNWSWFALTQHIKQWIKASNVRGYGQHGSQPIKLLQIMHLISATSFLIVYGHRGMRPGLQQIVEMKVRDGVF